MKEGRKEKTDKHREFPPKNAGDTNPAPRVRLQYPTVTAYRCGTNSIASWVHAQHQDTLYSLALMRSTVPAMTHSAL
jgi:hypothetical protein